MDMEPQGPVNEQRKKGQEYLSKQINKQKTKVGYNEQAEGGECACVARNFFNWFSWKKPIYYEDKYNILEVKIWIS